MGDSLQAVPPNGAGLVSPAAPALPPCIFEGLPAPVHEYLHRLESRVVLLEAEQKRFTDALLNAGKFLFENPASKMMLAAFPKDVQTKLREFFDARK